MKRRSFIQKTIVLGTTAMGSSSFLACIGSSKSAAKDFVVKQFEDKDLAHFSYAILLGDKVALIDPSRNPQIYYDYAEANGAKITAVIETHPHADFVSSHVEIANKTQAKIYVSKLVNATYPHVDFDNGDVIDFSEQIKLKAINTPGHSPDSISIILEKQGKDYAVFTGDALLFGSVGRPDLREYSGQAATERSKLAKQMYQTVHGTYAKLADSVLVFPAHGAGSLCASGISDIKESTIGRERTSNFAFSKKNEQEFVEALLADQPHIPKYFPYDVELNKDGAKDYKNALAAIPLLKSLDGLTKIPVVDVRTSEQFRKAHLKGAINIPDSTKFPTWLGTILPPQQPFYLVVNKVEDVQAQLERVAKIGYEVFLKGVIPYGQTTGEHTVNFDKSKFEREQDKVLILDIRSEKEVAAAPTFGKTLNIPLPDLEENIKKIPTNKPIYVHCASGYRSAIGFSLIKKYLPNAEVYDISDKIKDYQKK